MTAPSRLLGRAAALATLAATLLLVWLLIAAPLARHVAETTEEIERARLLIASLERRIAGGADYEAEIAALVDDIEQSGIYLRGETEPIAAAAMQDHLRAIVAAEGLELRSVQVLRGEPEDGLVRLALRVIMQGEYEAVIAALYRLETDEPLLTIDDLELRLAMARRRTADDPEIEMMTAIFDLAGYLPPEIER